jgi:hypothetical protein
LRTDTPPPPNTAIAYCGELFQPYATPVAAKTVKAQPDNLAYQLFLGLRLKSARMIAAFKEAFRSVRPCTVGAFSESTERFL